MNLDKSKKRIAKKVKMGFQGYPQISITYLGSNQELADEVSLEFIAEEGAEAMQEQFKSQIDVRQDEVIQSAIVKMIERSAAKTVTLAAAIQIKS
jgi:hypothetical protein